MSIDELAAGIRRGTALCALPDGTTVVAATGGTLTHHDTAGGVLGTATVGAPVGALALHPDGSGLLATVARRGLYDVRLDPSPAGVALRTGIPGARGLAVDALAGHALVTSLRSPGRVLRVPLDPAGDRPEVLATGVAAPVAVALRPGAGEAYVLSRTASAQLLRLDLATRVVAPVRTGLGPVREVAWTGPAGTQLALADTGGRVVLIDVADPAVDPVVLADGLDPVWSIDLVAGGGALVVGAGQRLLRIDLPVPAPVVLEMPHAPLYLSSWARIGVATTGVDVDDLVFRVEPPEGGLVSHSRDVTFDRRPSVLLATCGRPGTFTLVAHDRSSGDELATGTFEVTDTWTGVDGPPVSIIGEVQADVPDPAWGGGDPYVAQNLSVTPVLGDRRVGVVIAETADSTALGAADQGALRTEWRDEVFDGVVRGGVSESARAYWRDVSGGRMDLVDAGVVGPVRLPGTWDGYGTADATGQTDGWEAFARAAVAAIRDQNDANATAGRPPVLDLMTVDSVVLVLRSLPATATGPGRFVWPSATRPGGYQLSFEVDRQTITVPLPFGSIEVTLPIMRTIQMFTMPDDWETRESSGRVRGETVAHELGHNFGLPDEYARTTHPQWAKDRDLAATAAVGQTWSIMSWEEAFPQPVLVEKMMLGWVDAAHVRNLSFATVGPVDEEVMLHASDLGPPPAGRHSAVEIRIADGENTYFEYRREQPATPKDQDVPADRTVVATHCISGLEPPDRRNVLRLQDDGDGDRGELQRFDDHRQEDTSDAAYPNDFLLEVLETGADFARVHITYGDAKPDPQIRPWAPSTNWKSPDLRVANARNAADARFADLPWEGHDNWIQATVRNPGKVDASGVVVDFSVKDFTLGGGAETWLGSQTLDVPSGAEVVFTSSVAWVPPPLSLIPFATFRPHYCVVARIAEYQTPGLPPLREITIDNNEAQSNHTQLLSVSASPSSRELGVVKVTNPLSRPADCRVVVRQSSALARTYLEKAWVHLQPGEERDVAFMVESMIGEPTLDRWVRERREDLYEVPNSVRLTGVADDHEACHGFVTGGAHVLVRAGRATHFLDFGRDGGLGWGRIEAVDDGQGANGTVLVTITHPDRAEEELVRRSEVRDGDFRIELGDVEPGWVLQGHYLGGWDLAPCESWVLEAD